MLKQIIEDSIIEEDYIKNLKSNLTSLQFNLNVKLKQFIQLYPKMDRGMFYRRAAHTFDSLYKINDSVPTGLNLANNPQQANYYSNLTKTVLLFNKDYFKDLLQSDIKERNCIFKFNKNLDNVTILEQKVELYSYLNKMLKQPRSKKPLIKQVSIEHKINELERRISELESIIKGR